MAAKRSSPKKGPAWKKAQAYGFDVSLIEWNLSLTPLERIRAHNRALETITMLKRAGISLLLLIKEPNVGAFS